MSKNIAGMDKKFIKIKNQCGNFESSQFKQTKIGAMLFNNIFCSVTSLSIF